MPNLLFQFAVDAFEPQATQEAMSDDNKDGNAGAIGLRVKSLRRSAGLSQASLGSALGVTFQQVQKYESGQSKIAADKLQ
ncbi:helix-turn-helix domain-containing protein [Methylobacterium sp. CM6241]